MQINGRVSQIKTSLGKKVWVNIDDAGYAGIQIWANNSFCPTYLGIKDHNIFFLQFETEEWAKEWIKQHQEFFDSLTLIELAPCNGQQKSN